MLQSGGKKKVVYIVSVILARFARKKQYSITPISFCIAETTAIPPYLSLWHCVAEGRKEVMYIVSVYYCRSVARRDLVVGIASRFCGLLCCIVSQGRCVLLHCVAAALKGECCCAVLEEERRLCVVLWDCDGACWCLKEGVQ